MRRLVLVLPGLLSATEPVLDRGLPGFAALAERGQPFRLAKPELVETPEARWLGLEPSECELKQGPLTVAAFGADPPLRSLHFHVTLMTVDGVTVNCADPGPTADEVRAIVAVAGKLNTRSLTFLAGRGTDHALVWEGLGEMRTVPDSEALGKPLRAILPEGDAEVELRRFIDDSVNLLDELELNKRRRDEGHLPLNLLWPWGQGPRRPVPNLALRRGEPATVLSDSLRLAGLTRLVGYRHRELGTYGDGLQADLQSIAAALLELHSGVAVLQAIAGFRAGNDLEEAAYMARRYDAELLAPLLDRAAGEPIRLLLAAPCTDGIGLAVVFDSSAPANSIYPFDERTIEEARVPLVDMEALIDSNLVSESALQ